MIDDRVGAAIRAGDTCDITTVGRSSGQARRIEIWYFLVDGRLYLTGTPGPRHWMANLRADPALTFHVKQGASADLAATATEIVDRGERERIMAAIRSQQPWYAEQGHTLEQWVEASPLVCLHLDG